MSLGNKRSREDVVDILPYGSDSDSRSHSSRDVRPRESSNRDWRDEHLKIGPNNRQSHLGDSRRSSYRDDRDRDRRRDRTYDRSPRRDHRERDRGGDRRRNDRHPSGRDRPFERSYHHSRDRNYDRSAPSHSPVPSRSRSISASVKGGPKEEGEISPRISHLTIQSPASSAFPPSAQTGSPAHPTEGNREPRPSASSTQETVIDDTEMAEEEPSLEDVMAARRAKRQAILAKYQGTSTASEVPAATVAVTAAAKPEQDLNEGGHSASSSARPASLPDVTRSDFALQNGDLTPKQLAAEAGKVDGGNSPSAADLGPVDFSLSKQTEDSEEHQAATMVKTPSGQDDEPQVSAADYDPSLDRREDEERRNRNVPRDTDPVHGLHQEGDGLDEDSDPDEEDDLDDMFAAVTAEPGTKKKTKAKGHAMPLRAALTADIASDPEGYYQIILGEALDNGRYQVFSTLGKGMFSAVVRARIVSGEKADIGNEVAIKIVRGQESMYKAGLKEAQILNKLAAADPEDKKHIVRLERTFEHRGHLCLVFESLSMNLREVVKRFGKDVGLNIRAVRAYAHQLFLALSLMKKCNIMHADIKPDNILVNESKATLKLCDLGSASDVSENDITPYLVSRFYRAPEIILGLPYDPALDMWSVGCTLYELYTGKILFPGRTNNHMLLLMMELRGRFNSKMLKKSKFGEIYFAENGSFISLEKDKITGNDVQRNIFINNPTRDLRSRLVPPSVAKKNDDESKMILAFVDLLDKCLTLDPAKRLTPRDALAHPFIRG